MSKIRCLDISSKEFKALQKELLDDGMNINPYILATKVKLWQDGKGDIESMPTAQDLNIDSVFNRTDIEEPVTTDTPEITDVSELDNLNSEKNTIEKELKKLNAQIKRNLISFKNLGKFFKISNLNKRLNQVNQLLKNLNQQSEQAIAAADIVAESNNIPESTPLSVDESSNVQAINEKTPFSELPDGLKYLLAKHHFRRFNFVFDQDGRFFEEQDYALSVLTDEMIAAIQSKMQRASYAEVFIDWNKANNVTAKESTEEIVDEEDLIEENEPAIKLSNDEVAENNAILDRLEFLKDGLKITGGAKIELQGPRTKVKVGEVLSIEIVRGDIDGTGRYEFSIDVFNKDGENIGALPYDIASEFIKKLEESKNPAGAKVLVTSARVPVNGIRGIFVDLYIDNVNEPIETTETLDAKKAEIEKQKESYKKQTKGTPINKDAPKGIKVGDRYDDRLAIISVNESLSDNFDKTIADNNGLGYEVISKVKEYGEMENGVQTKAPKIEIIIFNNKADADAFFVAEKIKLDKYIADAELKALETSDIEEQGVVDQQNRFKLKGFRDLLPNLKNHFTEAEQRAFLKEYNKISTSEERAEQVVKLQNLINDKILAASRESSNVQKEQFLAKVDTINSNIEILRKNRNFPNMKAGFNIGQARNSLYFTKISKKIVDDFIKSQENLVYKDLQGDLSRAIEELFNFNRVSQQFSPVAYFKDVAENDLFKAITDELNNFHKTGSLSRNMVQKTNVYLGTRKFPFKVTYDILNRPRLISIERVRKKKAVQKEKSDAYLMSLRELSVVLDRIGDYKLTALFDVIQGLGPGGRYGLRDIADYGPESSTGRGVTSDPSQKGYIFRRTDEVGQKRKLFSTVKGLADKIFSDEVNEILNTTNDRTNLLEEYLSYGSVDSMIEYLREQVSDFLRAEGGDFGLNADRMTLDEQRAFDESIESYEKGSEEFIKNLVSRSDSALSEYFDSRNAYETSIEYAIQVGAFTGTRESLETDVQRALYDKVEDEKKLSEKEPGGTVDAPKSAEPVGDSFMDMLNKEKNSLESVLYSETKTNLDKIGLDTDLGYGAIVKKIKELKTSGALNMNSVVDIINIVLNKEFIERKDGKEGQIKLVNELLVEALRMGEISGNFTVQEAIQNINPGTYSVQINSNGNLVFTEIGNNDSKTPTTISLIDFIVNSSPQSSDQFKIIKSTDANFNSPIADAVMSKEDLKGLTENLSDIFSNFGSSITEFDNLELADLKAEIVTEFNKCK